MKNLVHLSVMRPSYMYTVFSSISMCSDYDCIYKKFEIGEKFRAVVSANVSL